MLVQIIKNYKDSYRDYSPARSMRWGDVEFTEEKVKECDFAVVLNTPKKNVKVKCSPDNVMAIMQEPYHHGDTDWMNDQLEKYHYVLSNHTPNPKPQRTQIIPSHGALHWYVCKTYDELKAITQPMAKGRVISCIASNLTRWPGHKKRVAFIDYLKEHNELGIDFYGKGTQFIEDKWDGVAPYKYSIVIENNDIDDYWTEKISDVYLGYALPFYFGCTNIDHYFPEDSYIWIDINDPQKALQTMREAIENNEWEKRIEAIKQARELLLDKYNLFPFVANFVKEHYVDTPKKSFTLPRYHYSLKIRFKRYLARKQKKIQKIAAFFKK